MHVFYHWSVTAMGWLFVAFLTSSVFAQQEIKSDREAELEASKWRKEAGIRGRESFVYLPDPKGKLPPLPYRNRYTLYDSAGHSHLDSIFRQDGSVMYAVENFYEADFLVRSVMTNNYGETLATETVVYSYDSAGNRIQGHFVHSDTTVLDTARYFYDENGLDTLSERTYHKWSPEPSVMRSYYDEKGRLVKWKSKYEIITYTYDDLDRIVEEHLEDVQFGDESIRKIHYRLKHQWDWAERTGKDGLLLEKTTFKYHDAEGLEIKEQ